jgi:hypothetical protein
MKKLISADELVSYLDKKTAQLEGDVIIQKINPFEGLTELSQADALNKMYEIGYHRGTIMGQKEILIEISQLIKFK